MPFQDSFTNSGANTNLESWTPTGSGTAWTRVDGAAGAIVVSATFDYASCQISTNTLYQCDDQGSANHYSQAVIKETASQASFLCNRATNSNNFIGARSNSSSKAEIYKRVSGSFTLLATSTSSTAVNDTIRIESNSANLHTVKINGATYASATDSAHSTVTRQGLCCRQGIDTWDDYEAGALTAAATSIAFRRAFPMPVLSF